MASVVDVLELRRLSKERLKEARILLAADKLHGAKYLCGYAIEHAIKYQICKHLGWSSYPPPSLKSATPSWDSLGSLKTHDLEILILFTGIVDTIFKDAKLLTAWNDVKGWTSEIRYETIPTRQSERKKIQSIIDSTSALMRELGCSPT